MIISGIKAIPGAIAHDIANRVEWKGPGYPLISDSEADNIVIKRGLCPYLSEAKEAREELWPEVAVNGHSSKELQEV